MEPLTLDELQEMDGLPVWLGSGPEPKWCLVHVRVKCEDDSVVTAVDARGMFLNVGKWIKSGARFYREKPDESPPTVRCCWAPSSGEEDLDAEETSNTGGVESPLWNRIDKVSRHRELCLRLNEIYRKKNHDYGDSFGQTFRQWGPVAAGVRMADKLNRFVSLSKQAAEVDDESVVDTLMDLANYAVMTVLELEGEE